MATLDYANCVKMIEVGHARAQKEKGRPISVAIVDARGDLVAFGRMKGAPFRTCTIAVNKAYSAVYMNRSTQEFGKMLADSGMQAGWFGDGRVTGLPGGVLIKDGDDIAGAIGVSGLAAPEDVEIAEHMLSQS